MNIDIIFVLNGRELVRYDYQNEFSGERQATKEQLAHDNDVDVEDIKIFWQILGIRPYSRIIKSTSI